MAIRRIGQLFIPVIVVGLVACSSFSTIPVSQLADNNVRSNSVNGLFYYLPHGLIHITGGPPAKTADGSGAEPTKKAAGDTTAGGTTPSDSQTIPLQQANYVITVSTVIEADPGAHAFLKPDRNYFYDDNTALTIGANGLLTTGNATATDQTINIFANVVSMAVNSLSLSPALTAKTSALLDYMIKKGMVFTEVEKRYSTAFILKDFNKIAPQEIPKFQIDVEKKNAPENETREKTIDIKKLNSVLAEIAVNKPDANLANTYYSILGSITTIDELINRGLVADPALHLPGFSDGYQVPSSLVSDLLAALDKDKMKVRPEAVQSQKAFVSANAWRSVITVADIKLFLSFYPGNQSNLRYTLEALDDVLQPKQGKNPTLRSFDIVFDPENGYSEVTTALDGSGILFRCYEEDSVEFKGAELANLDGKHPNGIAFRPGKTWKLTFNSGDSNSNSSIYLHRQQVIVLPDPKRVAYLDYDRMPFVSKITNVGFSNGMLISFSQNLPSPVMGVLGIPKAILQAILPLPKSATAASGTSK